MGRIIYDFWRCEYVSRREFRIILLFMGFLAIASDRLLEFLGISLLSVIDVSIFNGEINTSSNEKSKLDLRTRLTY